MFTLTNLYLAVKKLFDQGLFSDYLSSGNSSERDYYDIGDVSGDVSTDWSDYSEGDVIKLNLTADGLKKFTSPPANNKTKAISFLVSRQAGSNATLDFEDAIGFGGQDNPSIPDAPLVRRIYIRCINDNGTIRYEGGIGSIFLNVAANDVALTFDTQDKHANVVLENGNTLAKLDPALGTGSVDESYLARFGLLDQDSGKVQLSMQLAGTTTSYQSFEFGIATGLALSSKSASWFTGHLGTFADCISFHRYSRSGGNRTVRNAGNVELTMGSANILVASYMTILLNCNLGIGWFKLDNISVTADANDAADIAAKNADIENDINPHFTFNPAVQRRFAIAINRYKSAGITKLIVLNAAQSNATVAAHADFNYAEI